MSYKLKVLHSYFALFTCSEMERRRGEYRGDIIYEIYVRIYLARRMSASMGIGEGIMRL